MIICVSCRKEMICDKNGVGADFGYGHVYTADRYKCMVCGAMILHTNNSPTYDPDYKKQEEYLMMKPGNHPGRNGE